MAGPQKKRRKKGSPKSSLLFGGVQKAMDTVTGSHGMPRRAARAAAASVAGNYIAKRAGPGAARMLLDMSGLKRKKAKRKKK